MGNQVLGKQARLNLSKEYKKSFEVYLITPYAYKLNGAFFYLAFYEGKFSGKEKGQAVVSRDSDSKKELMKSFYPLSYYGLSLNQVDGVGAERANLNMQVFHDMKSYLESIVKGNVLDKENKFIYERALKNINKTIALQDDIIQLYQEAKSLHKKVREKGFFTDEDLEQLAGYLPYIEIIQYNQSKCRYEHRTDFDVIYKNRNHPDIKPFNTFADDNVLRELTSNYSGIELEKSLKYLSDNKDISDWTEEEHYQWLMEKQRKSADNRIAEFKNRLRYP
jgi:hypothetical protein